MRSENCAIVQKSRNLLFYSKAAFEGETEFNVNIYGKLEAALNQGGPTPEESKDYIVNLEWAMDHATIEDPKKRRKR